MVTITGRHELGPRSGRLLVRTGRSGLGRRAGHDLTIEVSRWSGEAIIDTEDPERCAVTVAVETGSFEVREGTGGVKPLTDGDRAEIKKVIRDKILLAARHPLIEFRSANVQGTPQDFAVEGQLTIMGTARPVTVRGEITDGRVRGSATIVQSHWGIRPYSAFFGALRLADEVRVEFDLALAHAG